jgi:hypothetical protein
MLATRHTASNGWVRYPLHRILFPLQSGQSQEPVNLMPAFPHSDLMSIHALLSDTPVRSRPNPPTRSRVFKLSVIDGY